MAYLQETRNAITVPKLQAMRAAGEKIVMLTCYDASFAALLERAGVDVLLIGDSLGNVIQGHSTTLPVTLQDIAYHTATVARGNRSAFQTNVAYMISYSPPSQKTKDIVYDLTDVS